MHFPDYVSIPDIFPDWEQKRDTEDLKDGRKTFPDLIEPEFTQVYENWRATTLLSTDRAYNLFQVARYVAANKLPGDFVECGVLFGGASIKLALFAEYFGVKDRKHFLFDTFADLFSPLLTARYPSENGPHSGPSSKGTFRGAASTHRALLSLKVPCTIRCRRKN